MARWLALTVLAAGLAACTPGAFGVASGGGAPAGASITIDVDLTLDPDGPTPAGAGGGYKPLVNSVAVGTLVRFTNSDGFNHTATSISGTTFPSAYPFSGAALTQSGSTLSGGFSSGNLTPGSTSQALLADKAGTYIFGCFYHYGHPMRAVVLVGSAGAPTPTPLSTPTPIPTVTPVMTPSPKGSPGPSPSPTAAAQVIHIGFQHLETTDATYGPVWYYATTASAPHAQVVTVTHGSLVVFLNDDSTGYFPGPHTAGGFGSSGFPSSFGASGNANQFNSNGSTIEGNQWSTGSLNGGQMSQVFTVGPPGAYWFGCGYHYTTVPTASNASMGDVLVSI